MRGSLDGDNVSPCVTAGQRNKKRFPGRWSLRQLIYSSPILGRRRGGPSSSTSGSRTQHRRDGRDILDGRLSSTSKDNDRYTVEIHRATSRSSVFASTAKGSNGESSPLPPECPLCLAETIPEEFRELAACGHRACVSCFRLYLRVEITESRVCIACPECHEPMHPNEIRSILDNPNLFQKYEDFMVRRVLAVDPDTRWCPAPDCGFAVIASECASCPKLRCERPGCDSYFCYHCKAEWHPNQTCDAARAQRSPHRHTVVGAAGHASAHRSSSLAFSQDSHRTGLTGDDMKPCPRCQVLIAKMDDGSCNHMMCAVCGSEFCWLCMKEINDLHFLSPSGCTFWGKKPWSRKKKILWQLGTLVGAPVGIALVAGITVPAMLIGIPVWVGKKLRARYKSANKHKRHAAMAGGVIASVLIAPILAGLAVGIGVPILLFYVYGVVPVSLCRSGGCGGGGGGGGADDDAGSELGGGGGGGGGRDAAYDAAAARATDPSIGEASLSMASGSQVLRDADRESASTVALAGSISQANQRLEVQADVVSAQRFSMSSLTESMNASIAPDDGGASVRALAGSMLSYKPVDSDSCSCITIEDCTSERVHFDDNVSFIASQDEKTSIGSSCSFRPRCSTIYIDIEERPRKYSLQAAILRSQFFHSINDGKPATKSLDDKTIIEVSNETLDKQSAPLIGNTPSSVVICQLKSASTLNLESSKL